MDGKFLIFVGVGLFIYAAGYLAWLDKNKRLNQKQTEKQNRHILMIFVSALVIIIGVFSGINIRHSEAAAPPLKNETTSVSNNSSSNSGYSKTCSWCGKSFTGSHYTHLGKMAGCQSSNSSSSLNTYCSMKCCSEARKSTCPQCR